MGRDADLFLSPESGFWADCPVPRVDPEKSCYQVFDDFETLRVGATTGMWTLDNTNGSIVLVSAEATTGLSGIAKMGTDGSLAEDFAHLKATSTNTGAPFKITTSNGKKLWYAIRFYVSSVTDCSYYFGLCDEAMTESGIDNTGAENFGDGVYFRTINGSPTEIDWAHAKNNTETEVKGAIATLAITTWNTLGFYFDGVSAVIPYVNGVKQDYQVNTGATNFPGDQGLTPFFYVKEGAGTATYIYVDWIKCVQIR